MKKKCYNVNIWLKPFKVGQQMFMDCLENEKDFDTPEQAREFAEALCEAGIAEAYRVVYIFDVANRSRRYNHEYVKYLSEARSNELRDGRVLSLYKKIMGIT